MKTVVLLSGGVDSAVALALKVAQFGAAEVIALSFRYGQMHARELDAAVAIAEHYGVRWECLSLPAIAPGSSALTGGPGGLDTDAVVVPGRNLVFLAHACALAAAEGACEVVVGCHADDDAMFPDCREGFLDAVDRAMLLGYGVRVHGLFARWRKPEIVRFARVLGVPLGLTWSCYAGGEAPCGTCGACIERRAALGEGGLVVIS